MGSRTPDAPGHASSGSYDPVGADFDCESPGEGRFTTTPRQTERPLVSTPLLRDTSALRCTPSQCISADWRNLETEHTIPELTSELCAANPDQ